VNASGKLQWIWFEGPYQNASDPGPPLKPLSDPKKIILWKIAPADGMFIDPDKVPAITYGLVPTGWVQEIPEKDSSPPALFDGYVYYVQAVPARGGGAELCVFLKNGEVHVYHEEKENTVCGKRQ
jgi:hypothetical protein